MNKTETLAIMSMLSAFYGQGKSDPQAMSNAWHLILRDYDYHIAERAVIRFAKNDIREYASFPGVGQIVRAIENESKMANRIFNSIYQGNSYDSLSAEEQALISRENYLQGLAKDKQALLDERDKVIEALLKKQRQPLLEGK